MNQQSNLSNRFKVVFLGDGGVGKSSFLLRHRTGDFQPKYIATLGVDVYPLIFNSNYGQIILDIWDIAGNFDGLRDVYYEGADAAVIMFDVTAEITYKNVKQWYDDFRRRVTEPHVPVVLCGNKVDMETRAIQPADINFHQKHKLLYYDISAKSNYNYEKPFLALARKLTGHEDLEFIAEPQVYQTKHVQCV